MLTQELSLSDESHKKGCSFSFYDSTFFQNSPSSPIPELQDLPDHPQITPAACVPRLTFTKDYREERRRTLGEEPHEAMLKLTSFLSLVLRA